MGLGIHSLSRLFPIAITRKVAAPQPSPAFPTEPKSSGQAVPLTRKPRLPHPECSHTSTTISKHQSLLLLSFGLDPLEHLRPPQRDCFKSSL